MSTQLTEKADKADKKSETPKKTASSGAWSLTDGVFVALASAYVYALAFAYEYGSASYFRLPYQLVNVELIQALVAGVVVYSAMSGLLILLNILSPFWHGLPKPIARPLTLCLAYCAMLLVPIVILGEWSIAWIAAIPALVVAAGEFALPLLTERKIPGYLNKLESMAERDRRATKHTPNLLDLAVRRSPRVYLTVVLAVMLLGAGYLGGLGQAKRQKDYLVVPGRPERVAVFATSNRIVLAEFDRETGSVGTTFTVLPVPSDDVTVLHLERLGPLKSERSFFKTR